jgi:hypothetical protein
MGGMGHDAFVADDAGRGFVAGKIGSHEGTKTRREEEEGGLVRLANP